MFSLDLNLIRLSDSAMYPLTTAGDCFSNRAVERRKYSPWTIIPRTQTEADALRAWIATHQTMFLVIGAATTALAKAICKIRVGSERQALFCLRLGINLRLASSVYTKVPSVDRTTYEQYVRPAMTGVRKGFSGVSSRETIELSCVLSTLRTCLKTIQEKPGGLTVAVPQMLTEALEADHVWWMLHGEAMKRMVQQPISLAQQEYWRRRISGENVGTHSEFLTNELQTPEALDDYDRFFACSREALNSSDYSDELHFSLNVSDPYICRSAPYKNYRGLLDGALDELPSLATLE